MERAVKEEQHRSAQGRPRQGDQPGAGRLPRAHRQERHGAAPRVPRQRLRVPGRQEHAARAWRSRAPPMEGLEKLLRRPDRDRLFVRGPGRAAKVATKVAKGEEKFDHQGRLRRRQGPGRQGRRGAVQAAEQGRAARVFPCTSGRGATELPRPAASRRPSRCSGCWLRASISSAKAAASRADGFSGLTNASMNEPRSD